MHIARLPEFAHRSIDKGHAGHTALPGAQKRRVLAPVEAVKFRLQIAPLQVGIEIEKRMREFAPAKLRAEIIDVIRRQVRAGAGRLPDLIDRNLAPVKMR